MNRLRPSYAEPLPLRVRKPRVAWELGFSLRTLNRRLADGSLKSNKDGAGVFITRDDLLEYVKKK